MKNLRNLRKSLRMTQSNFANSINLSRTCYSNYETDLRKIDVDTLILISEKYGVSIDYLLDKTSDPSNCSLDSKNDNDNKVKLRKHINTQLINLNEHELIIIKSIIDQFIELHK